MKYPHTDEIALQMAARDGDNEPLEHKTADYDGRRSVRLRMPQGSVGLATATYSYQLTHEERMAVARRIAALWNFAARYELSTEALEDGDIVPLTSRDIPRNRPDR